MKPRAKPILLTLLALAIPPLMLTACGDTAKPVPVKDAHAPPPYAGHGIDAVGVARDPAHRSPFGAPADAEKPAAIQGNPPSTKNTDSGK